jgi:hypothetical protein
MTATTINLSQKCQAFFWDKIASLHVTFALFRLPIVKITDVALTPIKTCAGKHDDDGHSRHRLDENRPSLVSEGVLRPIEDMPMRRFCARRADERVKAVRVMRMRHLKRVVDSGESFAVAVYGARLLDEDSDADK